MTRSKFLIELEELFIQEFGSKWAEGAVSAEEIMGAILKFEIQNKGVS